MLSAPRFLDRVGEVEPGGTLNGIPEGVIFILRNGNPSSSAMYFAAWGGGVKQCNYCTKAAGGAEFGEGFNCGASSACLFFAGSDHGGGLSVRAMPDHSFVVYALKNHHSS